MQNVKKLPDLYFALKHLDSSLVLTTHWENLNIDRSELSEKKNSNGKKQEQELYNIMTKRKYGPFL